MEKQFNYEKPELQEFAKWDPSLMATGFIGGDSGEEPVDPCYPNFD